MQDLRYNEVRREQLVTEDPEGKSGVLLTIRNVRVQLVGRNPQWKGVIVVNLWGVEREPAIGRVSVRGNHLFG